MDRIRVLVADDHALFRRAMQTVVDDADELDLAGEAEDGEQAIALAGDMQPDVVLMDIRMPKVNGIEATSKILERLPGAKVVMLSASDDEEDLFDAIKAGASGYLLKTSRPDEVVEAVKQAHAGHALLSPMMASKLVAEFDAMSKRSTERANQPKLTDREIEVLQHVADGLTNRQIGKALFISENTVKNHIRNMLEKLHLNSRMEAVMYAVREELIDLDPEASEANGG